MTIGTLSPTEQDLYKIVALVRQLAERNNSGVATTDLNEDAVTNGKLANMAQSTVKGRAGGAGTGDPTDLGVPQLPSASRPTSGSLRPAAPIRPSPTAT